MKKIIKYIAITFFVPNVLVGNKDESCNTRMNCQAGAWQLGVFYGEFSSAVSRSAFSHHSQVKAWRLV